jgi:Flp pilus assembly protein TadG
MILRRLLHDRRASVALWIGLSLPTLLMALGLGIEVASWSVSTLELQRTADAAALAGVMNYSQTSNGQSATGAAANVAEVNGVAGATSRSWSAATKTLTDNNITAAVVSGIQNTSDIAIKVTVQQNVKLTFSRIFSTLGSVNVSATAWSELVTSSSSTGAQPCLGALRTAAAGGGGVTMSGYTVITDPNCSVRSNAGVTLSGSGDLTTGGIYAAGSISIPPWVSVSGTEYPNDGTISDPYQSYAALQTAIGDLRSGAGTSIATSGSTTETLNPGTYAQFTTSGYSNLTLNPGLYIINGPISFSGSTTVTGSGVTIINSGSVTVGGYFSGNLTAPGTSPAGGGVPGILMASTGNSVAFSGGFSFPFTGVLYFPNAAVNMSGSTVLGSSGCAELIGGSLTFSGSANFGGSCSSYGAPSFGSLPATSRISLVQ